METNHLIAVEQFCENCNVESSFIISLSELGLVELLIVEEKKYIVQEQLKDLEKMIHFHYELNINLEGIDAIFILLKQIAVLQQALDLAERQLEGLKHENH